MGFSVSAFTPSSPEFFLTSTFACYFAKLANKKKSGSGLS
jgi:hypothetical protein